VQFNFPQGALGPNDEPSVGEVTLGDDFFFVTPVGTLPSLPHFSGAGELFIRSVTFADGDDEVIVTVKSENDGVWEGGPAEWFNFGLHPSDTAYKNDPFQFAAGPTLLDTSPPPPLGDLTF
jgi:hypothetical protein